ncbi:hypothetical protein C8J55DRAFT_556384 [Lentinula edodes]|uniref:Uncharacterized protein n=1 Tax=Lentinula lateritia TaxID=40482 RepID=A0A9W9AY58_9AGAR|nr:hypothetical protein C8J55DRAFT_556384 [Lentinula edodes]
MTKKLTGLRNLTLPRSFQEAVALALDIAVGRADQLVSSNVDTYISFPQLANTNKPIFFETPTFRIHKAVSKFIACVLSFPTFSVHPWRRVSEVRTKQDGHLDHHDEHDDQHRQQQTPERRTKKQHVVSPSRSPAPLQRGQPTTPTTTTRRSTDNANNSNKEVEVEVEDEVEAVYTPSLSRNIVSGAVAGTVVVVVSSLPWGSLLGFGFGLGRFVNGMESAFLRMVAGAGVGQRLATSLTPEERRFGGVLALAVVGVDEFYSESEGRAKTMKV